MSRPLKGLILQIFNPFIGFVAAQIVLDMTFSGRCLLGVLAHRPAGGDDPGRPVAGLSLSVCAMRGGLVSAAANDG